MAMPPPSLTSNSSSQAATADDNRQTVNIGGFNVPSMPAFPSMGGQVKASIIPSDTMGRLLFGSAVLLFVGGVLYAVKGGK